ncbi:MAG: hypothetical protein OHK0022_42290 [Roseiflexaceae bacterium]
MMQTLRAVVTLIVVLMVIGSGIILGVRALPRTLAGTVTLNIEPPVQVKEPSDKPRAYIIVLDVSGSNSWNFQGQAMVDGVLYQCGPSTDPELNRKYEQDRTSCQSPSSALASEPRIAVAKQALTQVIDQLAPDDWMQILVFSGRGVNPAGPGSLGTAEGKAALREAVRMAGVIDPNNPDMMQGGTPTATALHEAGKLLDSPDRPRISPSGQPYEPVVVLMTDGVPNYYLEKSNGRYLGDNARTVGWHNRGSNIAGPCASSSDEQAECQVGYVMTTDGQIALPLTAAIQQGQLLSQRAALAVIGYGNAPPELAQMVQAPMAPWYQQIDTPSELAPALADVIASVNMDRCAQLAQAQGQPPQPLPADPNAVGLITLRRMDDVTQHVPILADPASGRLSYSIDGLLIGHYTLEAWVDGRAAGIGAQRYMLKGDIPSSSGMGWHMVDVQPAIGAGALTQDLLLVAERPGCGP